MKKVLVVLSTLLFVSASVNAQDKFYPGLYFGVQGGANYVTSNNWAISHFKHISPNGQISLGYDFTPVFGLRGSISGPMGYYPTEHSHLNPFYYGQVALDATFDICNIFKYKEPRFFNPYIFLGAGANYRLAANDQAGSFSPAVRAGLGFDFRLSELVDLSLEFQDNALNNKFNTLDDNAIFGGEIIGWKRPFKWDDNFAALIGLKFNIGSVKKKAAARAQVENIYFDLDKYVIKKEEAPKVDHIVAVLNEFPDAVVTVSGYADKQTGKPKHNMTLSQNRAERVAKALKDAGIAASRITVNYYGDTVQVSDVREENRVAVVVTK